MNGWNRRAVLATGAALSAGGIASIGTAAADGADDDDDDTDTDAALPNSDLEADPLPDEHWSSYRGGAGHARYVAADPAFEGDALEATWSADHDGTVAVADGTVYTTTADGVVALDAADGSSVWETNVAADDPAVADEFVFVAGDEIVALDRDDGSVQWESDLGSDSASEASIGRHTVAYGGVFVVANGTLYALEADDGSVRWQRDSMTTVRDETDEEIDDEFDTGTAAANGVVYAGAGGVLHAFDPETGDAVVRSDRRFGGVGGDLHATSTIVVAGGPSTVEHAIYDAATGEELDLLTSETPHEPALGEEMAITGTNYEVYGRSVVGSEHDWTLTGTLLYGQPVICDETVYIYLWTDNGGPDAEHAERLVALDKHYGTVRWTLSADEGPIGHVRAIDEKTLYVDHEGELVALREGQAGDVETGDDGSDQDDSDGGDGDSDDDGEADGTDGNDVEDSDVDDVDESDALDGDGETADGTETDDADPGTGDDDDSDGAADPADDTSDAADDTDGMPGFTVGAGAVSSVLGLEWLRRRADATGADGAGTDEIDIDGDE